MPVGVYQRTELSPADRFRRRPLVKTATGCTLWAGAKNKGYGVIWSGSGRSTNLLAHRVSWELHNGPIPDGLCVCHKCDTPACVNPEHLFLGTKADNNADRDRKGRGVPPAPGLVPSYRRRRGEAHPNRKLDWGAVEQIRACGAESARVLAKKHGVSTVTIRLIKAGKAWVRT